MKRKTNRVLCFFVVSFLLCVIPIVSFANEIDTNATGCVKVCLTLPQNTNSSLAGYKVFAYKVGEIADMKSGKSSLSERFAPTKIELEDLSASQIMQNANKLMQFAAAKSFKADYSSETDKNGMVVFEKMPLGMYLICVENDKTRELIYSPLLIKVPSYDEISGWQYSLEAEPKASRQKKQSETTRKSSTIRVVTSGDSSKLPKTGILQWPIPILAFVGMCCFGCGWAIRRVKKDEK